MNRLVTSFALVGMATFAATAHADTAPPSAVSLLTDPTALAEWLRDHDAEVIASGARIEAAMAAERQAHVVPNPSLSLGYGGLVLGGFNWGGATPTQNVSFFSTPQITVGIGELIELGKRGPRGQAAELRAKEAVESAVGILGGRVSDATAALGKLAYLSAKHATLAANLADAKHLLALEKIRLDHDDLSGADYQRIELETQRIELDMDRADADQTSARAACEAAVYATCTVEGFDESTLSSAAQVPVVPDVTAAVIARPALAAARMEASALGHDAELAHARRIPDPTVGISYTWDDMPSAVGDQANTLMFSVSLPLALFDRRTGDAPA